MAILGKHPVRCKVTEDNKCLQHINNLKYLLGKISYKIYNDIQQKLAKFTPILEILSSTF